MPWAALLTPLRHILYLRQLLVQPTHSQSQITRQVSHYGMLPLPLRVN